MEIKELILVQDTCVQDLSWVAGPSLWSRNVMSDWILRHMEDALCTFTPVLVHLWFNLPRCVLIPGVNRAIVIYLNHLLYVALFTATQQNTKTLLNYWYEFYYLFTLPLSVEFKTSSMFSLYYIVWGFVYSECTAFNWLSGNESKMNGNALTLWWVDHVITAVYAFEKYPSYYVRLSLFFSNPPPPQVRIWFVGLWHFSCDLFYCSGSSEHGCPSTSLPCHQLLESQPLFLQWEAAFFQRDDLLCLYRGWHWGRDRTRGLDSPRWML